YRGYAAGVALLFAAAVWLRVTSLGAMPLPDSDEVWFADQIDQALHGRPFPKVTPTGNVVTFAQAPVLAPLLLFSRPASLWVLRSASVAAGVASIVLLYQLGCRVLDRPSAVVAAGFLAVLPFAIVNSRTGYDCSQTPLYASLLLCYAFRANLPA